MSTRPQIQVEAKSRSTFTPVRTGILQRAAVNNTEAGEVPPIVYDVLRSSGQPLDANTRAFMEPRFGRDFSRVRVHTDAKATESALAINALAYTVGRDVVFGEGQYAPRRTTGQQLLAHELTHTLQQDGKRVEATLRLAPKDDLCEREADSASQSILSGAARQFRSPLHGSIRTQIQCQTELEGDLIEPASEEEEIDTIDTTEVYDGDMPVNATPASSEATEEQLDAEMLTLAEGDEESLSETIDSGLGEVILAQTGGAKGKRKAKKAPPPAKKTSPKRTITQIEIDQAAQKMTLHWSDGTKEGPFRVSTGKGRPNTKEDPCKNQTEKNCTPNGTFTVGTRGDGNTTNRTGDRMSWYTEFVPKRDIGIHDSQPVPGIPASHGCVRTGNSKAADDLARKINKNVVSGSTKVVVFGKAPTKPWAKATPKKKK